MTFTSLTFLFVFLPLAILLCALFGKKPHNRMVVLSILSVIFYGYGDASALPFLVLMVVFHYATVQEMCAFKKKKNAKGVNITYGTAVVADIVFLAIYKYTSVRMPIGISFFTFTALSYLTDIKREAAAEKHTFSEAFFYMTFFPKLVSGPIETYGDMKDQIEKGRFKRTALLSGGYLFFVGMLKKVLIADRLGAVFVNVSATDKMSSLTAMIGVVLYGLQLYFDFSGYSDMAIGLAEVFGYKLKPNFNYPYTSVSVSDFWRRWHISLGNWFKNYIYIPLGGNRCSTPVHLRNLFIVWLITGAWHGNTGNFVVWGLYNGLFVVLDKYVLNAVLEKAPRRIRILLTDIVVFFGWIFFFSPNMTAAMRYIGRIFGSDGVGFADRTALYYVTSNLFILVVAVLASSTLFETLHEKVRERGGKIGCRISDAIQVFCLVLCVAEMVGATYTSFLYFAF